ncbi:uncharacterized protein MELLADRAFT_104565 [Melampsora larici-populina 98AG31]|uniref:Secreted protein n=1 Tax=Melampsora larici-populina (strain 98AG31 / pathotype 3-4-7) TaxID=747676 RepID=F4RF48_MELLP|nr:uncharacterized protein MELLADRAFT_104565 [Melampsora larici-populina 98AG31]EGG09001.1 hypothetical protein MELLADRAFT_104565 [Melampsora larici-populina 98AG31]
MKSSHVIVTARKHFRDRSHECVKLGSSRYKKSIRAPVNDLFVLLLIVHLNHLINQTSTITLPRSDDPKKFLIMLLLKFIIAAVLAVTISSTPNEKDLTATDTILERRAMVLRALQKRECEGCATGGCDHGLCKLACCQ